MAYTLQFGNTWKEAVFRTEVNNAVAGTCFEYKEVIGNLSPSLSIQEDILYPNALASVSGDAFSRQTQTTVGCRGNQLDNEFPLESRVQTCLPLIQYPTSTTGSSVEEMDMCAKPVLNWEKHIKELKRVLRVPLGYTDPALHSRKGYYKSTSQKPGNDVGTDEEDVPLSQRILVKSRTKRNTAERNIGSKKKVTFSADQPGTSKNVAPETEETPNEDAGDTDVSEEQSSSEDKASQSEEEIDEEPKSRMELGKNGRNWKTRRKYMGKNRMGATKLFKKQLFEEKEDLEEPIAERRRRKKKMEKLGPPVKAKTPVVKLRPTKIIPRDRLPLYCIKKYKTVPPLKLQSTWNHLYAGTSGACSTMESTYDPECRHVFIGSGTQLRMLHLYPSDKGSMLSYKIQSVWEEAKDKVPTNIRPGLDEPLSDLIYGIVPDQRNGIIGVHRGKSVEFYDVVRRPHLLISTPNICFGRKDYFGWQLRRFVKDPLLIGLDVNQHCAGEMVTIDENMVVNMSSYSDEVNLSSFIAPVEHVNKKPPFRKYPDFKINENAAGVSFLGTNCMLMWADSCVYTCDKRSLITRGLKLRYCDRTCVFDLRHSTSAFSWSDQVYFQRGARFRILNEYISSVKISKTNNNYYYVGTTSRLFMMDWRVPDNPVMKMNHGMRSAATYIDTYSDGNYEVVVAGAQRTHETCCLVTDHAHASCIDRPQCSKRNPIMLSYPKHLSHSRDFHNETQVQHMIHGWPSDLNRTKDHNYAWTTGLAICKSPRGNNPERPPGIAVFTGNHYGDIFYQEWDQAPVETDRKTVRGDPKLTNFLVQWRDSMETKRDNYEDLFVESTNPKLPVDVSILVKAASEAIPNMSHVRSKKFDIFKPDSIQDYTVKKNTQPLSAQVRRMKSLINKESDGIRSVRILDVWDQDWQEDDMNINVELGKTEIEGDTRRRYDFSGFTTELPNLPPPPVTESNEMPSESINENSQSPEDNTVLTVDQQEILNAMKRELSEDVLPEPDSGSDSDILLCEDEDDIVINPDEVDLEHDAVVSNTTAYRDKEMSQNAQKFSTQDLDDMGFPGLGDFYPVYNNPSQVLSGYDQDDFYNQRDPGCSFSQNQYGTMDQDDDNMNFSRSQDVYTPELFSQPNSQEYFLKSYPDSISQSQDTKVTPFPHTPLDIKPGTSGSSQSRPSSQSKSNTSKSYRPGF